MLLEGKTAVITGCSRGIGKAVLDRMTAQGASAFALVRREDAAFTEHCAALSEKYGVGVRVGYAGF